MLSLLTCLKKSSGVPRCQMTEYECEVKASPDRESAAAFLASSRYRMYSESTACAAALPVPACCNHTIGPISSAHDSVHVGRHGIMLEACVMGEQQDLSRRKS